MFMEEILKDVDVSLSWRQISELKRGSTALPSNRVPWKLISFPCLDSFPTTNTQQDWVFPCWLAFFFSSCKAQPPASRSFASQCQYAKAGLASHNQEALPLLAMIILTVLLSPHIICHLSHCTSPPWNQPPPSTTLGLGARRMTINAKVRALTPSFLFLLEW